MTGNYIYHRYNGHYDWEARAKGIEAEIKEKESIVTEYYEELSRRIN